MRNQPGGGRAFHAVKEGEPFFFKTLGLLYTGVQTAANAGVPEHQAGLAAALITASFQLGSALGLAVFSVIKEQTERFDAAGPGLQMATCATATSAAWADIPLCLLTLLDWGLLPLQFLARWRMSGDLV